MDTNFGVKCQIQLFDILSKANLILLQLHVVNGLETVASVFYFIHSGILLLFTDLHVFTRVSYTIFAYTWYAYDLLLYSWRKTPKKLFFLHDSWSIIHGFFMVGLLFKWQAKTPVTTLPLSLSLSLSLHYFAFESW